jgi:hypothetical protein
MLNLLLMSIVVFFTKVIVLLYGIENIAITSPIFLESSNIVIGDLSVNIQELSIRKNFVNIGFIQSKFSGMRDSHIWQDYKIWIRMLSFHRIFWKFLCSDQKFHKKSFCPSWTLPNVIHIYLWLDRRINMEMSREKRSVAALTCYANPRTLRVNPFFG